MSNIIITPYGLNNPRTIEDVKKAWFINDNTFSTPYECTSCMNRSDWTKYGNKLDGVTFEGNGLTVELQARIL